MIQELTLLLPFLAAPAASLQEDAVAQSAELVQRGRIAANEGRPEEALEIADRLAADDAAGADYLAGIALHRMAIDAMSRGGGMVEMQLADARGRLDSAVAAAPERFPDAWTVLCETAWYGLDLAAARRYGERATVLAPDDPAAWEGLGRTAFSQFVEANADEARRVEADADWQVAHDAFERIVRLTGRPTEPLARGRLARALWQLGDALVWKERVEEAEGRYSDALGWDPTGADFSALYQGRGVETFRRVLEDGEKRFRSRHGSRDTTDATLLWWLGYSRYELADFEAAEEAFLAAVEKWPAFANSWYYIALARYQRQQHAGALEALHTYDQVDRAQLEATLASSPDYNRGVLLGLTGWCASAEPPRNLDAAFLAELRIAIAAEDPIAWNDAGLFWRDAGDELSTAEGREQVRERTRRYERALASYERALELSPDDPALLNDAAVVLHYCLHRELDRARRMYLRSTQRAEEELARADLSADLRELYRIALRDSRNNLTRLERELDGRTGGAGSR